MEISKTRIEVAFEDLMALEKKQTSAAYDFQNLSDDAPTEERVKKEAEANMLLSALDTAHALLENLLGLRFYIGFGRCYEVRTYKTVWSSETGLFPKETTNE